MALKQEVGRHLIADDGGIGKTMGAGLSQRVLTDRSGVKGFAVLCPRDLCEEGREELSERFHLCRVIVSRNRAARLGRGLLQGESVSHHDPFLMVSLDYINSS